MGVEQSLDRKEKVGFPPLSIWYQRLRSEPASRYRCWTASPCDGCGTWPRWSCPRRSCSPSGRRTLRRRGSWAVPCGTRWGSSLLLRWSRRTGDGGRHRHWCQREHPCRSAYLRSKRIHARCSGARPWSRASLLRRWSCPWGWIRCQGSGKKHPWHSHSQDSPYRHGSCGSPV